MKTKIPLFFIAAMVFSTIIYSSCNQHNTSTSNNQNHTADSVKHVPDSTTTIKESDTDMVYYGKQLVEKTAYYLGPKGKVAQLTNGLNCQNCHLESGTKLFGNNFAAVAANFPALSPRSGKFDRIMNRINDCMQRSLNGKPLDTNSREMHALVAYLEWVGKDVPKGTIPYGSRGNGLIFINRAADSSKGKIVYMQKCQSCHGIGGTGMPNNDGMGYQYPPLWGPHSYNTGASMFRLTKLAGFAKANMPFGTNYKNPQLTDEEALDVAAFINSQPRTVFDRHNDFVSVAAKPVDHPFGPYADKFTEAQHKYGPYKPIDDAKKQAGKKKNI